MDKLRARASVAGCDPIKYNWPSLLPFVWYCWNCTAHTFHYGKRKGTGSWMFTCDGWACREDKDEVRNVYEGV